MNMSMKEGWFENLALEDVVNTRGTKIHQGGYQTVDEELPAFKHKEGDAGYDMYATKTTWIFPFMPRKIPVNLKAELPQGHFGFLTGRSGESSRGNVVLSGIIDYNYRGQISALVYRVGILPQRIEKGTRVAQMLVIPYRDVVWEEKQSLSGTDRGEAGFGASGRK